MQIYFLSVTVLFFAAWWRRCLRARARTDNCINSHRAMIELLSFSFFLNLYFSKAAIQMLIFRALAIVKKNSVCKSHLNFVALIQEVPARSGEARESQSLRPEGSLTFYVSDVWPCYNWAVYLTPSILSID